MAEYSKIKIADIENNEGQIEGVKANPRSIDEGDYKKLLNSLRESDLTDILPLKVYPYKGKYITIGGNMRLRALRELGVKEVQCIVIPEDTSTEVLNKAIILDNSTHGEWDWDMIANEWGDMPLDMWGVDVPEKKATELLSGMEYTPMYYEPEDEPDVKLEDCIDKSVYEKKVESVKALNLPREIEDVIVEMAHRFVRIDFEKVANYYFFKASEDEKKAIERLRLVLVDGGVQGFVEDDLLRIREMVRNGE